MKESKKTSRNQIWINFFILQAPSVEDKISFLRQVNLRIPYGLFI